MFKADGTVCCEAFTKELENKHCCVLMTEYIHNPFIPLRYSKKYREYYFVFNKSDSQQTIFHCPWCNKKLPDSLDQKYFEILKKEYGINRNDFFSTDSQPELPEGFKTDEWWKKRDL